MRRTGFRLCWIKLYWSDNYCTTAAQYQSVAYYLKIMKHPSNLVLMVHLNLPAKNFKHFWNNRVFIIDFYLQVEAAVCNSLKYVFLIVRNIHKKKLVLESLFNRASGLKACKFIKKRIQHRWLLWIQWNFLNTFFYWVPPLAASVQDTADLMGESKAVKSSKGLYSNNYINLQRKNKFQNKKIKVSN